MKKNKLTILFLITVALLLASILLIGGLYVVTLYYYTTYRMMDPISFADLKPDQYVTYIYDYKGAYLDKLHGEENREFAPLEDMPENLKNAVIAIEDRRFYEHSGVDLRSIMRAVYVNMREGAFVEGASTITQQLTKNNLLKDTSVEINRKVEEQIASLKVESDLRARLGSKKKAKNYILEQYLNSVNLAHGINGVKLGASYYYGKELKDLTLLECAALAAVIKNPVRFSPENSLENNRNRTEMILRLMLEQDMILYAEYVAALEEEIAVKSITEPKDDKAVIHSYFIDQVINDVAWDLMYKKGLDKTSAYKLVYSGGLKIYTTFDGEIQQIIDNAFADNSLFPKKGSEFNVSISFNTNQGAINKSTVAANENGVTEFINTERNILIDKGYIIESESIQSIVQPQGAFAIIDFRTGHVPAIGAGRGEKRFNMAFNRATQSKRQPGSCFKVLAAYLPAIDTGKITGDSYVEDSPYTIGGYSPNNYDFRYRGNINVRTAIRDSINVPAVRTLVNVGYETAFNYLQKLGFTTLVTEKTTDGGGYYTDLGPALALGGLTEGVTPLELAAAFGAIANNGNYVKPVFYTKVLDHDGAVLLENKAEPEAVMKSETSLVLTDMMTDVIKSGTGTAARFQRLDVAIAGKTGTTTDNKDLSFGGYTPYYTAAVWQGYDMPKELQYDKNYHLILWRKIMEDVHRLKGYTTGKFDIPERTTSGGNTQSSAGDGGAAQGSQAASADAPQSGITPVETDEQAADAGQQQNETTGGEQQPDGTAATEDSADPKPTETPVQESETQTEQPASPIQQDETPPVTPPIQQDETPPVTPPIQQDETPPVTPPIQQNEAPPAPSVQQSETQNHPLQIDIPSLPPPS